MELPDAIVSRRWQGSEKRTGYLHHLFVQFGRTLSTACVPQECGRPVLAIPRTVEHLECLRLRTQRDGVQTSSKLLGVQSVDPRLGVQGLLNPKPENDLSETATWQGPKPRISSGMNLEPSQTRTR